MKPSTSPSAVVCLIVLLVTSVEIGGGLCRVAVAQDEPVKKAGGEVSKAIVKTQGGEPAADASGAREAYPNVGVVVDEQGKPAAGVSVDRLLGGARRISTVTDADGKFQLVAPSGFSVYAARHEDGREGYFSWTPDKKTQPLRITLKPARELTVNVVDENGAPAVGAQVVAQKEQVLILSSGVTDRNGRWSAKVPADAEVDHVFAAKSGLGFDHLCGLPPRGSTQNKPLPDKIELKLAGARTVRIKAVDSSGKPIAGTSVSVWLIRIEGQSARLNLTAWDFSHVMTGAEGVAIFDWLPRNAAGNILFRGNSAVYSSTEGINVGPGTATVELEMPMVRRSSIVGRVDFADGRPAPNIRVNGRGFGARYGGQARAMTKDDGSYELIADGEQTYIVSIDDEHWAAPNHVGVIVRQGQEVGGIDFTLTKGTNVRGKVTVGADHHPAPNYIVNLLSHAGEVPGEFQRPGFPAAKMTAIRWATTDEEGAFRIRVSLGTYELGGPFGLKRVELVVADEPEIVHDIDMPRLLTNQVKDYVEFNVVDRDNQPIAGSIVVPTPRSPAFEWPVEMWQPASDKFQLPIALVPIVLQARSQDGRFAGIARVETDEDPRAIRLLPAAIARGRLLDDKGQAVAGGRLRCGIRVDEDQAKKGRFSIGSLGGVVTTGSDGSFELRGLVPIEEYVLEFEAEPESNRWLAVTTVKASMAESFELGDIRLQPRE